MQLWKRYGPGAAAALTSFGLGGADPSAAVRAAVLGAAIVAITALLKGFPNALRLVPVSRAVLAVLPVIGGGVIAGSLAVADAYGLAATGLVAATAIGVFAALAIDAVGRRAVLARPLRIAVLGSADFASAVRREASAVKERSEVEVVGWLNLGRRFSRGQADELATIRRAVTAHEIDLLVRGPGPSASGAGTDLYDSVAEGCLDLPVRMIDGNQLYEQIFGHVPIGTIDSAWFLFLMHPNFQGTSKLTKRSFDLVVGGLFALMAVPLVALGALAIRIEDRGPIFFRQRRVGERGGEFEILKLRTMRDSSTHEHGARWSEPGDDRVTRAGAILRRLHIDELPQLLNVLRGDMTLVGPRPEQPEITAALELVFPHYSRRLLVKPGVTGWAQIRCGYAGSELGTAWKLCHDLYYLKHRSLLADALIVLETLAIAALDSHRPLRAPQSEFLFREGRGDVEMWLGTPKPARATELSS